MAVKAKKKLTRDDIALKTLALAGRLGWANLTLNDIAAEHKISLAELHEQFEDKADILAAFGRIIDREVLENIGAPEPEISPRDRLFDILMERFDVLNEYRPGVAAVLDSFLLDPKQALLSAPHLCRSMNWMLEAAGIDANGARGALKIMGLVALYLKVLKTWKEDESEDLSKTMAALDKDLSRAESLANALAL
jgi:ubiquinone biosynthesis protein COQ9